MNKSVSTGLIIAIALLILMRFPGDTFALIDNLINVVSDIIDSIRDLIREFV